MKALVNELVADEVPKWKAACWDESRTPGRYAATLAFDANGKVVIFGVMEFRGESDAKVAECLRKQPYDFVVPAPGRPLTFDVPLRIP